MKIVCPCCQTDFPLEAGINDVDARAAVQRAFTLTPIGKALLGYVQLFKPEKRNLSWAKVVKILDQLIPMILDGKIEYKGRVWAAPHAHWESAIQQMLDTRETLRLPLDKHNYLFAIIRQSRRQTGSTRRSTQTRRHQPTDTRTT